MIKRIFLFFATLCLIVAPLQAQSGVPTYFYVVTAIDATTGVQSAFSNEVNGTFAAQGQHIVDLAWTASTSAVAGYNVFRGTVSGGPYVKINTVPVTAVAYSDTFVLPNAPSGLAAKVR